MTGDRRRWKRLPSALPLRLQALDGEAGGRHMYVTGVGLNPAGIFVQVADPPALGTRVRVSVAAEGTEGVLTAEGEVVNRVVLDQSNAHPPGCGLRLDTGPGWSKLYRWLSALGDAPDAPDAPAGGASGDFA